MSWIETITKEDFQLAVREAMKPEMEKLDSKITDVEKNLGNRIGNLEQRVSRLEGTIDGTMKSYESNVRAMFSEFKAEMFQRLLESRAGS